MTDHLFSLEAIPWLGDHRIDGTPFAPFALLVEELLDADETRESRALERIELVQPLMLRRDRPRAARLRLAPVPGPAGGAGEGGGERLVELVDDAGKAFVRARLLRSAVGLPAATPCFAPDPTAGVLTHQQGAAFNASGPHDAGTGGLQPRSAGGNPGFGQGKGTALKLTRAELYPDLYFHGPTFQADFTIGKADRNSLLVRLSGLAAVPAAPERLSPAARRAVIAGDLALQVAALHCMCRTPEPVVPWGCGLYARHAGGGVGEDRLLVQARRQDDDRYDIDLLVETDEKPLPFISWKQVEFRTIRSRLPEKARALLAKIRETSKVLS